MWEVGAVLEDDEIYQGYSDRFLLKFLDRCQVEHTRSFMSVCVHMCEGMKLHVIYYQVDSATAGVAASVAVGRSRRENELEEQLERAHAQVTYRKGMNFLWC